jgi:AcrR family transcriptional regulator
MFAHHGYDGASLPKIAREAQVAPPLIHYHFGSKERLWRETIDHSLGELRREATSVFRVTSSLAPLERLLILLRVHAQFAARCPDHFSMIVAEARAETERFAWIQEQYTGLLFEDVVSILREARECGSIRDVPLEQVAVILIGGILVHYTVYPSHQRSGAGAEMRGDFTDTLFDMLLRGITS